MKFDLSVLNASEGFPTQKRSADLKLPLPLYINRGLQKLQDQHLLQILALPYIHRTLPAIAHHLLWSDDCFITMRPILRSECPYVKSHVPSNFGQPKSRQ